MFIANTNQTLILVIRVKVIEKVLNKTNRGIHVLTSIGEEIFSL